MSKDYLSYEELNHYRELLEIQAGLLDELFLATENMLREFGYDMSKFSLNKHYAQDFLAHNMVEFSEGGGMDQLGLVFDAVINDVEYKTYATAECDDDMVNIDVLLLKRDCELNEWLVYNGVCWERGPGDDFV